MASLTFFYLKIILHLHFVSKVDCRVFVDRPAPPPQRPTAASVVIDALLQVSPAPAAQEAKGGTKDHHNEEDRALDKEFRKERQISNTCTYLFLAEKSKTTVKVPNISFFTANFLVASYHKLFFKNT